MKIGCLNPFNNQKQYLNTFNPYRLELSHMINKSYLTAHKLKNTNENYAVLYSYVSKIINLGAILLNYKQMISVIIYILTHLTYINSPTNVVLINQNINNWINYKINNKPDKVNYKSFQIVIIQIIWLQIKSLKCQLLQMNLTNQMLFQAIQIMMHYNTQNIVPLQLSFQNLRISNRRCYQSYISGLNLLQQANIQKGTFLFFH
ncbi:unnamed protein product [Paramecium sonneborni]|uniref:Uncharacterized protein n=1 Tax=Paramecium sonneborni TaxID=65129 RepID=A0A8S1PIW7_9CILI|nr:unnamed protein product [Paramecium sonneborni]